jgi:peptide chain release factor 3
MPVLGVVGQLQFEVLQHRLENEYSVEVVILERCPIQHARWVRGEGASIDNLEDEGLRRLRARPGQAPGHDPAPLQETTGPSC